MFIESNHINMYKARVILINNVREVSLGFEQFMVTIISIHSNHILFDFLFQALMTNSNDVFYFDYPLTTQRPAHSADLLIFYMVLSLPIKVLG